MIKHGEAPYLECSSAGDKRFSAFYATVDGQTIESLYQAFKVFEGGVSGLTWKEAKGKKALNQAEARVYYSRLWDRYIDEHPELHQVLIDAKGLSDKFGQSGHACQATELWRIRERLKREQSLALFSAIAEGSWTAEDAYKAFGHLGRD